MDRNPWNAFVAERGPRSGAFLQSWEWGEFQQSVGRKVVRRGDLKDWAGQFIEMPLPFGQKYLYCPKGPIGADPLMLPLGKGEVTSYPSPMLGEGMGEVRDSVFVRVEPSAVPTGHRARRVADVQPSHTLITDLTQGTDALLGSMHEKTRYNIRLSERKGVEVEIGAKDFDAAWPLFMATGSRGGFRLHGRPYYEAMLKALPDAFLAVARYGAKVVAANVMVDFAGTRTYLHGASSDEHRNAMAPFLLHWKLVEDAKGKGLKAYDWWGVAPEGASASHPWAGITRFKLGFGGERVDSPGTYDLPVDSLKYAMYSLARRINRIRSSAG